MRLEKKSKADVGHLHYIITRCLAWGFSSSGVERTFPRGGWLKAKREVPADLANDELRAIWFPDSEAEQAEPLDCTAAGGCPTMVFQVHRSLNIIHMMLQAEAHSHGSIGVGTLLAELH